MSVVASGGPAPPYRFGSNLANVPAWTLASLAFHERPARLQLRGVRERAAELFARLAGATDALDAGRIFSAYMDEAYLKPRPGVDPAQRRHRATYRELLAGWGVDSNARQGAVLKGWVESRFGFAPTFHKAMRFAGPVRKQLGVRSLFNLLGPLTNPAGAPCQLIGVFAPELTETFADVLKKLGSRRVLVVHGHDGMDEITLTTATRCSELKDGRIKTYDIDPLAFFEATCTHADLEGGGPADNAAITRGILKGEIRGPKRDIVLFNAAASLLAANGVADLPAGIRKAAESIDSGAALDKLERLIAFSRT